MDRAVRQLLSVPLFPLDSARVLALLWGSLCPHSLSFMEYSIFTSEPVPLLEYREAASAQTAHPEDSSGLLDISKF